MPYLARYSAQKLKGKGDEGMISKSNFVRKGALLAVGVAVVVGASWTGYHRQHSGGKNDSHPVTNTPVGMAQQEAAVTSKPEQAATKRMYVKEWGVQLPLQNSVGDAYYVVSNSTHDPETGQPNTVWVGLNSLNGTSCDATRMNKAADATPVGAVIRVKPSETDPVSGMTYTQKYPNGVTIDGYYYAYLPWKNKDCTSKTKLQSVDAAFGAAAKTMVKATGAVN
jgi:hypothetical protein